MNKKLLTVAIGAALALPIYAAQADVKISGQMHLSADYLETPAVTATDPNGTTHLWNVSSNVSNIKLDASEDLGGGMKAVFSMLEYVRLDNNYGGAGSPSRLFDGPTYGGLASSFGSVVLGNLDTGAKVNGRAVDLFNNQIGDSRNLGASNNRVQNTAAYLSPNLAGASFVLAHSTNVDNSTTTAFATNTADTLMVKYEGGPVMVGLAYDKVDKPHISTSTTYENATYLNLAVGVNVPGGVRIVALYEQNKGVLSSLTSPGAMTFTSGDQQKIYGIGAAYTFLDKNTIKVQYYSLTESSGTLTDGKAKITAVGYDYAFSKTFKGYVAYASTKNDSTMADAGANALSMAGGGHGDNPGAIAGQSMNGLSIGAIFNF